MGHSGRRPEITPELIETVCKHVSQGVTFKDSAVMAGISERTFHNYKVQGEKDESDKKDTIFVQFLQSLKKAEAEAISRNVKLIQKAALTNWTAGAWWLERRYPEQYGRRIQEVINIPVSGDAQLSEEKRKHLEKEMGLIFGGRKKGK